MSLTPWARAFRHARLRAFTLWPADDRQRVTSIDMRWVTLDAIRRFSPEKMVKAGLFESDRFFCDLYCFEAGQAQRPHVHTDADKVYVVLEGRGTFRVGTEERNFGAQTAVLAPAGVEHGVVNPGPDRLILLVFMAPKPRH